MPDAVRSAPLSQVMMNTLLAFIALSGILYFAQDILIPIFMAALLAILLAPLVRRVQLVLRSKIAAVVSVVLFTFLILATVGGFLGVAVSNLAAELPQYESNLREKAGNLKLLTTSGDAFEKAADVIAGLNEEITRNTEQPAASADQPGRKPILVEVQESNYGALQPFIDLFERTAHPLAQLFITFIMLAFMLFNREDMRNRFVHLAGVRDVKQTTMAIDDATTRLANLFRTQLIINSTAGAVIGTMLFILGVPGAWLWGTITAMMRFAPYVGTLIASVLPIAMALAVGEGWLLGGTVAVAILCVEVIVGHLIEPLAFGKTTGLSPLAIVVAAIFWTAIWGPIGLVLSTPLTIMLLVIGKNIESLRFLDVLLGNEAVLPPPVVFYQRMLARDALEAIEQAESGGTEESRISFLEEVAIPGLLLAREDERRGVLAREQAALVAETFADTLDEVFEDDLETPESTAPIAIVAANGPLNFAAALAVSAYLRERGMSCQMMPQGFILAGRTVSLPPAVTRVLICHLEAPSLSRERYLERRIRARAEEGRDVSVHSVAWTMRPTDALAGDLQYRTMAPQAVADLILSGLQTASLASETENGAEDRSGSLRLGFDPQS